MQGAMWCEAATSHCWAWLGVVIAATRQLARFSFYLKK